MKKLLLCLLPAVLITHYAFASQTIPAIKAPEKSIATQIGVTFEERNTYLNGYLFVNQMINKRFYWEVRTYYIYSLIVNSPPSLAIQHPSVRDERNLSGTGNTIILGYNIPLTCKVSLLPFLRYQYLKNTIFVYDDIFGNQIRSNTATYYLGSKIMMEVTDLFLFYANYYAGYARSILHGRGFFTSKGTPIINSITSTFEIGGAYKIADKWTLTPYIQLVLTGNNPNHFALDFPFRHPGLTTAASVFAMKLAYKL